MTILLLLLIHPVATLRAQSFTVLHAFTGENDGGNPNAGVTLDRAGRVYGATAIGYGTVFRLAYGGSGWLLTPLHDFSQLTINGDIPYSRVVFGPDGNLYGTTWQGGEGSCSDGGGCGTVYRLQPPLSACKSSLCLWTQTVLYRFSGPDGGNPYSEVIFDQAGNLYGTTTSGGSGHCNNGAGCGVVYELTPSGGGWTESILHSFASGNDGEYPAAGLVFDGAGNLYGTTVQGGRDGQGMVFELTPFNGGWRETILHAFQGSDGSAPWGSLIADAAGNLYGTTTLGGPGNGGTAFELANDGSWTYSLLYGFTASLPYGSLAFDNAGNLYGTTYEGGANDNGTLFKLTPSGGSWTETVLHNFGYGDGGGVLPLSGVTLDSNGNIYGTASGGGQFGHNCEGGCGTVYEVSP